VTAKHPSRAATLQALLAVTVWGASFATTKRALAELSPATLLFARTVLGTALIAGGLALRGQLRPIARREWPRIFGLALLGLVCTQTLQAIALERSTSATTAWLVALNPVVTAFLAAWLIGEQLAGKLTGLTIAFCGAVLVVSRGASLGAMLALPQTRGDLLTIVSTISWSLYMIYGRGLAARHHPPLIMAHFLGAAALAFAPSFFLGEGWHQLGALSTDGWLCLAYLGLGCSGLAAMLYYGALEHLEASQAAAFIYLEPLIAQVLSVVTLGEPFSAAGLAGGAAILAGVYLVSRARPAYAELETP